jgi:hypothetical protein
MLTERLLYDIWVKVEMSDGTIIDLDSPKELAEIRSMIVDPEWIESNGHVKIQNVNVMSKVCLGIK